jgi:tRNA(Ser,Leu) C12 N-acetylase TAN1
VHAEHRLRRPPGHGWNVVACVYDGAFGRARRILRRFGYVRPTGFRNVLLLEVTGTEDFLARFARLAEEDPDVLAAISRIVPAHHTFHFDLPEEFEERAREIALGWVPELAGLSFHVRLHRRGLKGRMQSPEEERFLDAALLEALAAAGTPGSITFEDPDAIISIETAGNWAGMSLWTREDLERYPFLKLD